MASVASQEPLQEAPDGRGDLGQLLNSALAGKGDFRREARDPLEFQNICTL